jgi:hypothetical protein
LVTEAILERDLKDATIVITAPHTETVIDGGSAEETVRVIL